MADDRCKCENRYKNKFQYLKRFTTKISFWCQRIVTKVMSQLSPIFINLESVEYSPETLDPL